MRKSKHRIGFLLYVGVFLIALVSQQAASRPTSRPANRPASRPASRPVGAYQPRGDVDTSGYGIVFSRVKPWSGKISLSDLRKIWHRIGFRFIKDVDRSLRDPNLTEDSRALALWEKASLLVYENRPGRAYQALQALRGKCLKSSSLAREWMYKVIFFQGVAALRRGENENCILCRGESSCILPIRPSAVHRKKAGSRLAIVHFREYLRRFPDDLEVKWLLNLAHMTLGQYPKSVDPKYLVSLKLWTKSKRSIGRFRNVAHRARVHKFDLSGGAIMEDFDNDGLLDLVVTSYDTAEAMVYYRNLGNGRFEKRSRRAGLGGQLGGLYAVQTDYNNDGRMDVFVVRGAWLRAPVRPSLLRNNGNGTFSDVTQKAGLGSPINAISASWADYDNDGHLDVFIPCESQPNRLYRNKGDGTFEEVSARAGVRGTGRHGKGAAWLDYDNDGYPDLFVTYYEGYSQLLRNNRNGTFTDVTNSMKVKGPRSGFSTWAFDYNNDGFLDIFAASGESRLIDVIRGLFGKSAGQNKLYRNIGGKRFVDVTKEAGLDVAFAAMGSNYGDFDNDGYLDIYLGTGAPDVSFLVPNRMLKNVAGQRFEDISVSSGTAHLQKGHAVAIGDIRRVGKVDLYVQMGGAITGDKFHNLLFQNPGQGHNWITLKLVGQKTNRAAIGARIKVVSGGSKPLVVHRHVSSGSSFGANPLEQTIGLGMQKRIKLLEIYWPTSKTTQRFRNVSINQAIKIVEFQKGYSVLFKGPTSNKQ